MSQRFDAIVIGAGQSGPFLAARLVQAGKTVALIEREHLGGTCVNDGWRSGGLLTRVRSARCSIDFTARGAAPRAASGPARRAAKPDATQE